MNYKIDNIHAREILDSRGNPTIEVEITSEKGLNAVASVPSGASTGSREALELRDHDNSRFGGKGVHKAINNIERVILPALRGMDVVNLALIDHKMLELDGTINKSQLGANAILGVSLAAARLGALAKKIPLFVHLGELAGIQATTLPVPCFNILNGGIHSRWQGADFQEYMIAPVGAPDFREALRWGSEVYQALKNILLDKNLSVGVGDEGGFAPLVGSNREPLQLITQAIEKAGYRPGEDIRISLDPASSEFFEKGVYHLRNEKRRLNSGEMIAYYQALAQEFAIASLEDGLAENDWTNWVILTQKLGDKIEIVGDDLLVTNVKYIQKAITSKAATCALIKLNQIGSVSETIEAVKLCRANSWDVFVSHRSGETPDDFIADLAVGLGAKKFKSGAPARGERIAKYNRLLRISELLDSKAVYAGQSAFPK